MLKKIVYFVLIFFITAPYVAYSKKYGQPVSLYKLLVTPEDYIGRHIVVIGFYGGVAYTAGLYPSVHEAQLNVLESRVLLSRNVETAIKDCHWSFVKLNGYFDRNRDGIMEITEVYRVSSYGIPDSESKRAGPSIQCFPNTSKTSD